MKQCRHRSSMIIAQYRLIQFEPRSASRGPVLNLAYSFELSRMNRDKIWQLDLCGINIGSASLNCASQWRSSKSTAACIDKTLD